MQNILARYVFEFSNLSTCASNRNHDYYVSTNRKGFMTTKLMLLFLFLSLGKVPLKDKTGASLVWLEDADETVLSNTRLAPWRRLFVKSSVMPQRPPAVKG